MVCNVTEDGKTKAITGSGVCESRSGLRNVNEGREEKGAPAKVEDMGTDYRSRFVDLKKCSFCTLKEM